MDLEGEVYEQKVYEGEAKAKTLRITRSMTGSSINRIDLKVTYNLENLVKQTYKIRKETLMSSIPNPHYSKTTKLYVILYDYLKIIPCCEYNINVFRNPILTVQLYLLPNVLKQFNLFANYYQQKTKLPFPEDIKYYFESMICSNDALLGKNMVMENLNIEFTHLHKMFGKYMKVKQDDSEMKKRLSDVFKALDEVMDIMNEDMLNDVIPLLQKNLKL